MRMIVMLFTLILAVLKYFELINWSWKGVFTPFAIYIGFFFLVELLFGKKIREQKQIREGRKLDEEYKALARRIGKTDI